MLMFIFFTKFIFYFIVFIQNQEIIINSVPKNYIQYFLFCNTVLAKIWRLPSLSELTPIIWRPSSLSELTPIIFNMGLTHLGSEASISNMELTGFGSEGSIQQ